LLALLHARRVLVCVYAFDLIELQGRDFRDQPLEERRARLATLLARGNSDLVRLSESFPDAKALLAECARLNLEDIVCRRKDWLYRSRPRSGGTKMKTDRWKVENQSRAPLFAKALLGHTIMIWTLCQSCDGRAFAKSYQSAGQ
jgi:ATP-dependent DNA ligase